MKKEDKFKPAEKPQGDSTRGGTKTGKRINEGITSADILVCGSCGKKYFKGQAHSC
jgi:hypothetical protein